MTDLVQQTDPTMAALDPATFEQLQRYAGAISSSDLWPKHLKKQDRQGTIANALIVSQFALSVGQVPVQMAQKVYVIDGKLSLEGSLAAALVNQLAGLEQPLNFRYEGSFEDDSLVCVAFGTMKGTDTVRETRLSLKKARTRNAMFKDPEGAEQKLAYGAALWWARRHAPHVLLGVQTIDEAVQARDAKAAVQKPASGSQLDQLVETFNAPVQVEVESAPIEEPPVQGTQGTPLEEPPAPEKPAISKKEMQHIVTLAADAGVGVRALQDLSLSLTGEALDQVDREQADEITATLLSMLGPKGDDAEQ